MVWPTLGSRKAKEQNRTEPTAAALVNEREDTDTLNPRKTAWRVGATGSASDLAINRSRNRLPIETRPRKNSGQVVHTHDPCQQTV